MSETTKSTSTYDLVKAGAEKMLDGRYPTTQEDWQQIFNWMGIALDGSSEKVYQICLAVWACQGMPISEDLAYITAYLRQVVDFQRQERRNMGIPDE